MVNIADIHKQARTTIHATLGLSALYSDDTHTNVTITARWTNKSNMTAMVGDLESEGYSQVYDPTDKVIFAKADATAIGVKRGGRIVFPDYDNVAFILNELLPGDGPITTTWAVTRAD